MERAGLHPRTVALTLIGAFLVFQGLEILFSGFTSMNPDRAVLYEMLPVPARATAWIVLGVMTAGAAWTKWWWVGASAMVVMPLERIASYAWSYAQWLIPGEPGGDASSLPAALKWAALAGLFVVATAKTNRGVPSE